VHTRSLKEVNTGCPAGCAPSGCVYDSTSGGYKCNSCLSSLLVNTATGKCDCPPGKFGADGSCDDCWKSYYCPGGVYTGVEDPPKLACPSDMTTNGRRSTSIRACGEWQKGMEAGAGGCSLQAEGQMGYYMPAKQH